MEVMSGRAEILEKYREGIRSAAPPLSASSKS